MPSITFDSFLEFELNRDPAPLCLIFVNSHIHTFTEWDMSYRIRGESDLLSSEECSSLPSWGSGWAPKLFHLPRYSSHFIPRLYWHITLSFDSSLALTPLSQLFSTSYSFINLLSLFPRWTGLLFPSDHIVIQFPIQFLWDTLSILMWCSNRATGFKCYGSSHDFVQSLVSLWVSRAVERGESLSDLSLHPNAFCMRLFSSLTVFFDWASSFSPRVLSHDCLTRVIKVLVTSAASKTISGSVSSVVM